MYGVVVGKLENLNDDIGRVGTEFVRNCIERLTREFVEVGETLNCLDMAHSYRGLKAPPSGSILTAVQR